ncbi:TPA: glycosyltransferase family 4 protein, partial [Escherichia coli]|nr:glycosyltransferase family 4 protein [Escherichia coli]HCP3819111.1 glycosyltransferase [Escherichia coli]
MKKNINIHVLINSLTQGGAEKVALKIANGLNAMNSNARVVSVTNNLFYKPDNVKVDVLSQKSQVKKLHKFIKLASFFFMKKNNVTLCFSLDLTFYLITLRFFKIYNGKIICRFINNPDFEIGQGVFNKIKRKILYRVLSCSDAIVCQSDGMLKKLSKVFNNSKLIRIYNPVDDNTASGENAFSKRLKLRPKSGPIRLLFVGRFTRQKNMEHILLIATELEKRGVPFLWTLVGDGELFELFKRDISNIKMEHRFKIVGAQRNISTYYEEADITTLVSHYEGLPNVLLESISHNVPCVSYNCPTGPSEIIIDGVNGMLVDMYDVEKFVDAILFVYNDNCMYTNIKNSLGNFEFNKIIN